MHHSGASRHALYVVLPDGRLGSGAVAMAQFTLDDVGDDFHVVVRVRAKSLLPALTQSSLMTRRSRKPMCLGS